MLLLDKPFLFGRFCRLRGSFDIKYKQEGLSGKIKSARKWGRVDSACSRKSRPTQLYGLNFLSYWIKEKIAQFLEKINFFILYKFWLIPMCTTIFSPNIKKILVKSSTKIIFAHLSTPHFHTPVTSTQIRHSPSSLPHEYANFTKLR